MQLICQEKKKWNYMNCTNKTEENRKGGKGYKGNE